jgi:3-hydroxyacyl-CoA dehydrogenase
MASLDYSIEQRVAVIRFAAPPVNSLSHALRSALVEALERAKADETVDAVVLIGSNATFCAGADIKEFGTPAMLRGPGLSSLNATIEDLGKPVVAAIEGVALGGGLELAMSCHHRVALSTARLGLPEVKLGLLPGAGGTQRLPRLIGVENALNVMLSGDPLPATMFAGSRLLDKVVNEGLAEAAIETALASAVNQKSGASLPRARDLSIEEPDLEALCQFARNTVKTAFKDYPAPSAIIEAVQKGAVHGFTSGLEEEHRQFRQLLVDPVSASLRHIFFAERAASRIDDLSPDIKPREITKVAIIGAGTMGTGIAINFLMVGIETRLLEVNQEALDRGVDRIRQYFESRVKKGKLAADKAEQLAGRLIPVLDYSQIGDTDLVIEAVFEDMTVKKSVFTQLDTVMREGAILATNTSTLDVDEIAMVTSRPADVIGLHFFSPANVMKLLEVVRGRKTSLSVLATAMALAKKIRKTAIVSGVCDGFIGNRMINQYSAQALAMLEEGASPQQIDAAIEKFGFAMGPFRMSDLAGNDIGWHIRKRQLAEGKLARPAVIADRLCELGRFGQKTGAGWYDYRKGDRQAYVSDVVQKLIAEQRAVGTLAPRILDDAEIVDRLVFSLVNEGAKILEERIAQRASDIDLVYLTGYGFPIWRGGPMHYAESRSLYEVARRMRQFVELPGADREFWQPAERLQQCIASGEGFDGGVA